MRKIITLALCISSLMIFSACSTTTNTEGKERKEQKAEAADINTQLGLAYLQRNSMPEAKDKLLLAVQQNPNSPTALDSLAYYFEVTGDTDIANKYYKQSISVSPHSGRALNNYGTFLCRKGKYKEAEKYLLMAANEQSYLDTAAAYENAGLCQLGIPNYDKAIAYFKRAIQQDPNRDSSYLELANVYTTQGNTALAKQTLQQYTSVAAVSSESLWLDIQVAKKENDTKTVLRDGLLLQQKFPDSQEVLLYKKMMQA